MLAASVPEIERLAGIQCYCTSFEGTGGSIKHRNEEFKVSEILEQSFWNNLAKSYDDLHRYPLYILEKEGVDSNHGLMEIEREHQISLRVMGIKDARAATRQFAGMERSARSPPPMLRTEHVRLALVGFTMRPIGKESLAGNEFEIVIHGTRSAEISNFLPQIEGIANFYGLQRFGSERLVTHLVGREIVRRNFRAAVELLLSYTTEYDTQTSKEIRIKSADPKNYQQLLRILPRGMDVERQVISALAAGRDYIAALRAVPIKIRRLFVQAYQAYIFNKCLSMAILNGENLTIPREGDICFEMEDPFTFGRIVKYEKVGPTRNAVPAVRMAGYSFQPGKGRFDTITKILLEEEGIAPKEFYIKEMQELGHQGGFRQAPLWCTGFAYEKGTPLLVSFRLPKGSYATTLLRELIKPEDPIKSGF